MNERDLFLAALEIADPEARRRFLDQACGGNVVLRASVEALFASHDGAGNFLKTPDDDEIPLGFLSPSKKPDSLGRLGHYEVLEVIGK